MHCLNLNSIKYPKALPFRGNFFNQYTHSLINHCYRTKDGRLINTVGRQKFQSTTDGNIVRLKISGLSAEDAGNYSCRVETAGSPPVDCTANLIVREKVSIPDEPSDFKMPNLKPVEEKPRKVKRRAPSDIEPAVPLRLLGELEDDTVKSGGSITLCVTYSSSILPDFKWLRNGRQMVNMPGKYEIIQSGGRLMCTINNASMEDAGEWTLIVETPNSTVETKCKITVKEPPKPIEDDDSKSERQKSYDFELPAISRIRQRKDSDSSIASSLSAKRARHMEEEEKEKGEPPRFHHLLEDLSAREGENVILSVTSTTIPQPNVLWYRNGLLIERTSSDYIVKSDQGNPHFS